MNIRTVACTTTLLAAGNGSSLRRMGLAVCSGAGECRQNPTPCMPKECSSRRAGFVVSFC